MKFLKNNVFTILCIGFSIWYVVDIFDTIKGRILFPAIIIFFVFGMLLTSVIVSEAVINRIDIVHIIASRKYAIFLWIISALLFLVLAGFRLTAIILSGLSLYAILMMIICWVYAYFRSKRKSKS